MFRSPNRLMARAQSAGYRPRHPDALIEPHRAAKQNSAPDGPDMTYHAELAPRRSRSWLIATPLILVLALAAGWSALWFYASGEAETRINAWQAQQAAAGRTFTCGNQAVGGVPFRIQLRCAQANVELKDATPPIAIKLNEILVVTQVWQPTMLIAEFTGPLTAS